MTVAQSVRQVLTAYPATRQSLNHLVLAYWIRMDGWPETQKEFARTTSLESIVREARTIFAHHPELSPDGWKASQPKPCDLFTELTTLFPDAVRVG